jgi:predicted lysophospholipase L1 biosynthesis ABC-type transport system permease subunit
MLEGEGRLRGIVTAAMAAAVVAGLLVVLGALGLCGTLAGGELEGWALLGASPARLWTGMLRSVTMPAVVSALAAALFLEAAGLGARYSGVLPWKNLPPLPPWPHAADWMLAAAAVATGLLAGLWSILPVVRRGGK